MEEYITTPPKQILHYMILEKLEVTLNQRRNYISKINLGASSWPVNDYKASLDEMFILLYAHLEENLKKEDFEEAEKNLETKNFEKLDKTFKIILRWLKKKRLTDFATKRNYDTTNIEEENFQKGL